MKIFRFIKIVFFIGLTILSNFTSVNSLSCISMNNQPSKERPGIIIVATIILYFILLALKQVNVVAIVIILMIRMQKCVPDVVKDLNVKLFNLMC